MKIEKAIPERPVHLGDEWESARAEILELLNREIYPMLRSLRTAANGPNVTPTKTQDYQATLLDNVIPCDTTNNTVAILLPSNAPLFHNVMVGDVTAGASVNSIFVTTPAAEEHQSSGGPGGSIVNIAIDYQWAAFLKISNQYWIRFTST